MVYVVSVVSLFWDLSTSTVDYSDRLVSEMTHYVSCGMLNRTHSFSLLFTVLLSVQGFCAAKFLRILKYKLHTFTPKSHAGAIQFTFSS